MTPSLPPELVSLLAKRDEERLQRARGIYASLKPRDQRLVREAAVMGYVLGSMRGPHRALDAFPTDDQITAAVLLHIDREPPPYYPTIRRACRRFDRMEARRG